MKTHHRLLSLLYVVLCGHVHMHVHVRVYVSACVCLRSEVNVVISSTALCLLSRGLSGSLELTDWLRWLTGQ